MTSPDVENALGKRGLLPQEAGREAVLLRETHDILRNKTRNPTTKEKEGLEGRGFFFVDIDARSLGQLMKENPKKFGHVSSYFDVRDYVPPKMTVAFKQEWIVDEDKGESNLVAIERGSKSLRVDFPQAKALMLSASTYAQAQLSTLRLPEDCYAISLNRRPDSSNHFAVGTSVGGKRMINVGDHFNVPGGVHGTLVIVPGVVFVR